MTCLKIKLNYILNIPTRIGSWYIEVVIIIYRKFCLKKGEVFKGFIITQNFNFKNIIKTYLWRFRSRLNTTFRWEVIALTLWSIFSTGPFVYLFGIPKKFFLHHFIRSCTDEPSSSSAIRLGEERKQTEQWENYLGQRYFLTDRNIPRLT